MTKIAILPEPTTGNGTVYRAIAGARQSTGKTPGEALDALTAQLPAEESATLVIVQSLRPDSFFTAEQQCRLAELMARWRTAREAGRTLPVEEAAELDALIDAELRATGERGRALLHELEQ